MTKFPQEKPKQENTEGYLPKLTFSIAGKKEDSPFWQVTLNIQNFRI